MALVVFKQRGAEHVLESGPASPHAELDLAAGLPDPPLAVHDRVVAERSGRVTPQQVAHGRQRKAIIGIGGKRRASASGSAPQATTSIDAGLCPSRNRSAMPSLAAAYTACARHAAEGSEPGSNAPELAPQADIRCNCRMG